MRTIQLSVIGAACCMLLASHAAANPCVTQPPKQLGSGNWYQLVGGPGVDATYAQAKAAAAGMMHNGLQGYLATITSNAENLFIARELGEFLNAYIAGTDAAADGIFRWDAGPENGQLFWNGAPVGYANFAVGEPNGVGTPGYAEIAWFTATWNDATGNFPQCYIVEYAVPEPALASLFGLAGLVVVHTVRQRKSA